MKLFALFGLGSVLLALAPSGQGAASSSCALIPWRLTAGPLPVEKTGQHTATFVLTNPSQRRCTFAGYPRIALRDNSGRRLAFSYSHRGDQMITKTAPMPIGIAGGGRAYFAFNKYRCDIRARATARVLRVLLPGSRRWLQIRMHHYPIIDYCPAEPPSTAVTVSPIVKTLREAAARI